MKDWLIAAAAALTLASGIALQSWRLHNARLLNEQQAQTLALQQTTLDATSRQLTTLAVQAEQTNNEQARLRELAADTQAALSERQKTIVRLQHENDALKRWADTALPADIIRLRQRPTLTGGHAYREWLSQTNALSLSGGQPTDQRRSE